MGPEHAGVERAYLEHLSADDLALLATAGYPDARDAESMPLETIRRHPGGVSELLFRPGVFDAVFGPEGQDDPLLGASPFLAFAVAVHRAATELRSITYVTEWLGPGRRAPVFDVVRLRNFVDDPWRRLFLVELLASYTHVASGSVVVRTRRGRRRQRFSELDPVRLAGLLQVVSPAERPGVLRRLGDVALFLTGVFPDYVARQGFGPVEEARLLRAGGMVDGSRSMSDSPVPTAFDGGAVGLLERLGRRWYAAAFRLLSPPVVGTVAVLAELPDRFDEARRVLGLVTERHLFVHRDRWFGLGGG